MQSAWFFLGRFLILVSVTTNEAAPLVAIFDEWEFVPPKSMALTFDVSRNSYAAAGSVCAAFTGCL